MNQTKYQMPKMGYGTLPIKSLDELYKLKIQKTDQKIEDMRKKKEEAAALEAATQAINERLERNKRVQKEKERVEKELAKARTKLFESFGKSEDEIFQKKKEQTYLFIYQIEEENLMTEELTAKEIEERLDKFALCRHNYVIITGGKVIDFPLNNNLKP